MLSLPAKKSEAYKRTSVEIRIHSKSAEKRRRSLAVCSVLAIFAAETDRGMKSVRRCLPLLALLLLLAGSIMSCSDTSCRDALLRAEALMETDPQAARTVLDSIDPPPTPPVREGRLSPLRGSGKGVFALYALLRTQADCRRPTNWANRYNHGRQDLACFIHTTLTNDELLPVAYCLMPNVYCLVPL